MPMVRLCKQIRSGLCVHSSLKELTESFWLREQRPDGNLYCLKPKKLASLWYSLTGTSMLIPIWVLVLANIYFGIDTDLTVGMAQRATAALLGTVR